MKDKFLEFRLNLRDLETKYSGGESLNETEQKRLVRGQIRLGIYRVLVGTAVPIYGHLMNVWNHTLTKTHEDALARISENLSNIAEIGMFIPGIYFVSKGIIDCYGALQRSREFRKNH
jgi:hypothetical protein